MTAWALTGCLGLRGPPVPRFALEHPPGWRALDPKMLSTHAHPSGTVRVLDVLSRTPPAEAVFASPRTHEGYASNLVVHRVPRSFRVDDGMLRSYRHHIEHGNGPLRFDLFKVARTYLGRHEVLKAEWRLRSFRVPIYVVQVLMPVRDATWVLTFHFHEQSLHAERVAIDRAIQSFTPLEGASEGDPASRLARALGPMDGIACSSACPRDQS
jgi:hypothetical protein